MAVGRHPVCARSGGAVPVFGDSQMQDAVAARMGKRKASMARVCCVASVESRSGWKWDCVKLGRGHQTQRKAMKRTHAPLCPGPTRQSCRSRESLDSAAQSRAPDPRALATGYRLWMLFRDGVLAGVSLGSPVARLRQEARRGIWDKALLLLMQYCDRRKIGAMPALRGLDWHEHPSSANR